MTSRRLWKLLLVERSPFPLFIRIAPRAHRPPDGSIWRLLSWYTFFGLYASGVLAPFMFRGIAPGILLVVFGSPAFVTVLIAYVALPFVILGGIFFGLRIADAVSRELDALHRNTLGDLIRVSPAGRWGVLRSVGAGNLRRRGLFFGAGIYELVEAHLALSIGFAVPAGAFVVGTLLEEIGRLLPTDGSGFTSLLQSNIVVLVTVYAAMMTASAVWVLLLHADLRQSLMFGVTAGIFGGTVVQESAGAWTGAVTVMFAGGLVTSGTIAVCAALGNFLTPPIYGNLGAFIGTGAGWGIGLWLREMILRRLWGRILAHEGVSLDVAT